MPSRRQKEIRRAAARPAGSSDEEIEARIRLYRTGNLPACVDEEISERMREPDRAIERTIVQQAEFHRTCRRGGCRRNGRCMHLDKVPCWSENIGALRKAVFAPMKAAMEKQKQQGAIDDAAE